MLVTLLLYFAAIGLLIWFAIQGWIAPAAVCAVWLCVGWLPCRG